MAQRKVATASTSHHAQRISAETRPWIERLGRFGYAAKGFVYTVVGVLAAQTAFGSGGATTGTQGALERIVRAPFGQFLLLLITVGLAGYALWRWIQAIMDTENKGSDAKGLAARAAYAIVGLIYVGLAASAIRLVLGSAGGSSGGDQSTQHWTARLLAQPLGQWIVGIVGAIVIAFGFYQLYQAYNAKFREQLKTGEMSDTEETWATYSGKIGYAARGIVFGIIGVFLIVAAFQADASEARGLGGALQTLARQPYGQLVLGVVAAGLVAYGVYCFIEARYRRMVVG